MARLSCARCSRVFSSQQTSSTTTLCCRTFVGEHIILGAIFYVKFFFSFLADKFISSQYNITTECTNQCADFRGNQQARQSLRSLQFLCLEHYQGNENWRKKNLIFFVAKIELF
jgi:hypothetical protein